MATLARALKVVVWPSSRRFRLTAGVVIVGSAKTVSVLPDRVAFPPFESVMVKAGTELPVWPGMQDSIQTLSPEHPEGRPLQVKVSPPLPDVPVAVNVVLCPRSMAPGLHARLPRVGGADTVTSTGPDTCEPPFESVTVTLIMEPLLGAVGLQVMLVVFAVEHPIGSPDQTK